MTPDRDHGRDDRKDIPGLALRAGIRLPEVIRPDGTASLEQWAMVPPGISLAEAFLPHREIDGPAASWTGPAIVGTRLPDVAPYIKGLRGVPFADAGRFHITRPRRRADIRRWLYDMTGYRYAPAAFWRVAGWEIEWVATWLDQLHGGGLEAELIVAERQASAAVRALWTVHDQGARTGALFARSGVLLALRALLDMAAALRRVIRQALRTSPTAKHEKQMVTAMRLVVRRLAACANAAAAADAEQLQLEKHAKLGIAIDHARALVEAVGLFTVASEPVGDRVLGITERLARSGRRVGPLGRPVDAMLDAIAGTIEGLSVAGDDDALAKTGWCDIMTAGLDRLQNLDRLGRLEMLARVRTDLVYKLVVTRRLDRLFEALPWMAAPSGAFPVTFGGPLNAAATLFEAGRAREIALELKRRVLDSPIGPRLDTRRGLREYADPVKLGRAVRLRTRAGFLLTASATSHDMVKAFLAGEYFGPKHPLSTLAAGRTDWHFETALQDPSTLATVSAIELGKTIYGTKSYDRDLPRYMGMTLVDVLAAPLVDALPGDYRGPAFGKFVERADARRDTDVPHSVEGAGAANRELLRSALKSIDTPTDGIYAAWRDEGIVPRSPDDHELGRFEDQRSKHIGRRGRDGGAVRGRAREIRQTQGSPGRDLQELVDMARTWRRRIGTVRSDDRPLAAVLSGRTTLPGLTPCAQTFMPIIWFRPGIDSHIHDWVAEGAPMESPLALANPAQAGLIAEQVQTVGARMPLLFGRPISADVRRSILVPYWTGLAGITADHAHVLATLQTTAGTSVADDQSETITAPMSRERRPS